MRALLPLLLTPLLITCGEEAATAAADQAARMEALLEPSPHSRLVLEIDAVAGLAPSHAVQDAIREALDEVLDKPDGIAFIEHEELPKVGSSHAWTDDELFSLAKARYDLDAGAGAVKIHVMVVDGHSASDSDEGRILGLAWSNTHLVLFAETLAALCQTPAGVPIPTLCDEATRAVWLHELGHIIGLVNRGAAAASEHADPAHDAHCDNEGCVMYWAYERQGIMDLLKRRRSGEPPVTFDEACRMDLEAAR